LRAHGDAADSREPAVAVADALGEFERKVSLSTLEHSCKTRDAGP
jgi:hypothetical protein